MPPRVEGVVGGELQVKQMTKIPASIYGVGVSPRKQAYSPNSTVFCSKYERSDAGISLVLFQSKASPCLKIFSMTVFVTAIIYNILVTSKKR